MKLDEIYSIAIQKGVDADPRGRGEVEQALQRTKRAYDKLDADEREFFDLERLTNPYADTRIAEGDPDMEVRGLLVGIDMEVAEVVLADRLRERREPIDLLLAHHPEGLGFAGLDEVMAMQADMWHASGVRIGAADALIAPRAAEVRRKILPANHYRAVDAARLLGLAMMSCHTPADNAAQAFVQAFVDEERPRTLEDLVKALRRIPEYADAARKGCGPQVVQGSPSTRAGKAVVEMTGGTEGPADALDRLSEAGVDTLVGMHYSEDHRKRAEELKLNLVVAGHISSDTLGMNLVLDPIEAAGVRVYATSGMVRISR